MLANEAKLVIGKPKNWTSELGGNYVGKKQIIGHCSGVFGVGDRINLLGKRNNIQTGAVFFYCSPFN